MPWNIAVGGFLRSRGLGSLVMCGVAPAAEAGADRANCFFVGHLELPDLVNSTEGAEFELPGGGLSRGNGRKFK